VVRAEAGGADRLHRPLQAAPERARLPFEMQHPELIDQTDDDDERDKARREVDQAPRGAVHGIDVSGSFVVRRGARRYNTNSANFFRSMLPPEITATMGPSPALPLSAAATPSAPAPSAMTRTFPATRRMARRTSSSVTTIEPSTIPCIRSHIRGKMLLPPAPSTNEACQLLNSCGEPFSNDSAPGAAVSGSAPRILTCGASWRTALPMPEIRPPPPMAAMTVFTFGRSARISRPSVAMPALES